MQTSEAEAAAVADATTNLWRQLHVLKGRKREFARRTRPSSHAELRHLAESKLALLVDQLEETADHLARTKASLAGSLESKRALLRDAEAIGASLSLPREEPRELPPFASIGALKKASAAELERSVDDLYSSLVDFAALHYSDVDGDFWERVLESLFEQQRVAEAEAEGAGAGAGASEARYDDVLAATSDLDSDEDDDEIVLRDYTTVVATDAELRSKTVNKFLNAGLAKKSDATGELKFALP